MRAASEKKTGGEGCAGTLVVSGSQFFWENMKQSFSTNFRIAESSNLDYVIHFCKPERGLSGPVFTIKILVAEIFDCYLAGN